MRKMHGPTLKLRLLSLTVLTAFILSFWPLAVAFTIQDEDTVAIDAFIARQARREKGEEYREARKVLTGDLTHDDAPETVALYTIEGQRGSNLYIQYLAIFIRRNGKLSPLTHTSVGGKLARSVELASIQNNSILMETMGYGPKDAACCPSMKGTTTYVLMGNKLRERKQRTSKAMSQDHP